MTVEEICELISSTNSIPVIKNYDYVYCTNCIHGDKLIKSISENTEKIPAICDCCYPWDLEDGRCISLRKMYKEKKGEIMKKITKFDDIKIESIVTTENGIKFMCGERDDEKVLIPLLTSDACLYNFEYGSFPINRYTKRLDIIKIEYNGEIVFDNRQRKQFTLSEILTYVFNNKKESYSIYLDDVYYNWTIENCFGCGNEKIEFDDLKMLIEAEKIEMFE